MRKSFSVSTEQYIDGYLAGEYDFLEQELEVIDV